MAQEEELKQAITLIRAGNKGEAVPILKTILKTDRNNERAWFWMSACVDKIEDKIFCLHEALRINPNNENVKTALSKLEEPSEPTLEQITLPSTTVTPQSPAQVSILDQEKKKNTTTRNILILIGLILVICCIATVISFNRNSLVAPNLSGYQIDYVVSGTANGASITYDNAQGGTEQVTSSIP
ncbi:tetratricopeptide repeat protein [Candidatus Bathyarchaeota archaeon]|nr:tetratricopeptide repeat protein [Candidatus Bathyarchaeota archaeon]